MSLQSPLHMAIAVSAIALITQPAVARDKKPKPEPVAEMAPAMPLPDTAPAPETAAMPAEPAPMATELPPSKTQSSSNNIVQNIANSTDHSTLSTAVKAAGVETALSGAGPFTLFAPTNAGFAKLPAGTVDTLLKPENADTLSTILSNHVVAGSVSVSALVDLIKAGGGKAQLKTLAGQTLTAGLDGTAVILADSNGNIAHVTQADMPQSNGVVHVIDGLLLPKPAK
ncbi:MAG: fasciclin domain-containing protein [Chakrabartia sp.]